jgi:hypothetical protein
MHTGLPKLALAYAQDPTTQIIFGSDGSGAKTRLVRLGLPRPRARALAGWWERAVHPPLYPALHPPIPVCVAAPVRVAVRPRRGAA